ILLPTFYVTAMLLDHDDLWGTDIRIPCGGLAITGPVWEAMAHLPLPTIRDRQQQSGTIICHCYDWENGLIFVPEGLLRLGLCLTPQHSRAGVREEQSMDSEVLLNPIGLAVVEMVWIGALAATSFGP
ncbi:hypothetical protein BV22DRAFT_978834, partial [Leucogyrophana mollusca]